ncbi:apoptosis regulator Bcl-2-like [Melanotaenia boesemani]|uniref:apoptosis regulator Bcl-2-like n=1 Tax=Melanotaenia boesemani TaxID=1250792 RepID=UPI001C056C4C|nr:apoptosis regulator Bcl-2-like [Melanotaenia boesemani]
MAATYSSRDIVDSYLRYKLLSRDVTWHFPSSRQASRQQRRTDVSSLSPRRSETAWRSNQDPAPDNLQRVPSQLQVALQSASDKFEQCYHGDLSAQVSALQRWMDSSNEAPWRSLTVIRNELFRDGVNWGRIVTMMALGGALSAEVAGTGEMGQLDNIADWMVESLDSPPLQRWIEENGGWDAFVELYESRPPVSFWSMRTVFGLVVLGAAGITLGALFTQR